MTECEPRQVPMLVFSDDWGRHPSSCQHLVRRLLDRHEVWWVNTIGTRKPRLDLSTLARGLEKLKHWFRPVAAAPELPEHLHVLNPKMWPWFSSALDRRINRKLLLRQLTPVLQALPQLPIAVTTLPIVADLVGALPVRRWVYYCVDDFGQWPGLDQEPLRRMEEALVQRAEVIVAVSANLQERLAGMGRSSHLLTHGVDLDFWSAKSAAKSLPGLEALARPLVVFWGVIDRRMDVALVRQLATDMKEGTILLVGPEADPDPALFSSLRVVRHPPVPLQDLPALAADAAVLIMPYADLPVTRAIQPLKLKEYLATGKPTVVRDLPATRDWSDCLDLADSPESFSQAVRLRIGEGIPLAQRLSRECLTEESWSEKARQFERWALAWERSANAACC